MSHWSSLAGTSALVLSALAAPLIAPAPARADTVSCELYLDAAQRDACYVKMTTELSACQPKALTKLQPFGAIGLAQSVVLCNGTLDHEARLSCFDTEVKRGVNFVDAVQNCTSNPSVQVFRRSTAPAAFTRKEQTKRTVEDDVICSTTTRSISDNFDENFVAKSLARSGLIHPGAVFHLSDILNGPNAPLGGPDMPRRDYDVYLNFNDSRVDVDAASLSRVSDTGSKRLTGRVDGARFRGSVNEVLDTILVQNPQRDNFSTSFSASEVHSDTHLNVALKGAASYNGFKMNTSFDLDKAKDKTKVIGQFLQGYYSLHVDESTLARGLDGWFAPSAHAAVQAEIDRKGPLVYVDTVVYGRAAYFTTLAEKTDTDVAAMLKASYTRGKNFAKGQGDVKFEEHTSRNQINATFIGQSGGGGLAVTSMDEFRDIINDAPRDGARGQPVAYTLKFVEDKSVAMTSVNTSFPDRTCTPLNNKVAFNIDSISVIIADDEGTDNDSEIHAQAMVSVTYDTFEDGKKVEVFQGPKIISIAENVKGRLRGEDAVPDTRVGKKVIFDIPDDPATEANEVKTARFSIQWMLVYEDDDSSANDTMFAFNPTDQLRTLTLTDFEKTRDKSFRFRGTDPDSPDADVEFNFSLTPED